MKTEHKPRRLDVRAFAESGETLTGAIALQDLERIAAQLHGDLAGEVRWEASGQIHQRTGAPEEVWVDLRIETEVPLECQRCLDTVSIPVEIDRPFLFAADEKSAAELDAESDEDVLVLSRAFDLVALIEDEVLLALPIVPRHETCPKPVPVTFEADVADAEDAEARPNPFAKLAVLKKSGG
ncbi:YceD family protein [Leptothrix discophora]|uniref:Large ribosomal RNA subunit accumulation protein YceD n=1 Tax=Leptothrix discophora TaxID=89 RepID=A0ABT9G022_LEPDI|nr:YceD family protein [Leptothrix discophora]MDP4299830.1 YceD family protein [Leptothrix discophora]